jgi:hypothetical protein
VPGYLVEEDIYYFPEYNPTISFDSKYEEEIAIIGEAPYNLRYTFSIFGVIYAAVGRKHFERLKKILQEFGESSNLCYFELERISSNPKDKQKEETYMVVGQNSLILTCLFQMHQKRLLNYMLSLLWINKRKFIMFILLGHQNQQLINIL